MCVCARARGGEPITETMRRVWVVSVCMYGFCVALRALFFARCAGGVVCVCVRFLGVWCAIGKLV